MFMGGIHGLPPSQPQWQKADPPKCKVSCLCNGHSGRIQGMEKCFPPHTRAAGEKKAGHMPGHDPQQGSDGGAGGAPLYYQPIEAPTPTAASLPEFRPEETVAFTSALSATRQFMPSAMPLLPMK